MRLAALFAIAGLIALAIQTTMTRLLPFAELMPSLTVILVVELARHHEGVMAVVMAFVIGYAADALSGTQLGLNALIYTLIFIGVRWFAQRIDGRSMTAAMIAVFGGVLAADLLNFGLSSALVGNRPRLAPVLPLATLQAAVTALCAPPLFRVLQRSARFVGLRPRTTW